jgi:hypothetical protein
MTTPSLSAMRCSHHRPALRPPQERILSCAEVLSWSYVGAMEDLSFLANRGVSADEPEQARDSLPSLDHAGPERVGPPPHAAPTSARPAGRTRGVAVPRRRPRRGTPCPQPAHRAQPPMMTRILPVTLCTTQYGS